MVDQLPAGNYLNSAFGVGYLKVITAITGGAFEPSQLGGLNQISGVSILYVCFFFYKKGGTKTP